MAGHPSAYAATALAENGIFTTEMVGGAYVFSPERYVTRGEFLSMCMTLSGDELLSGVAATGFADDAEIAEWLKPYVATALMDGVVSGYSVSGGAVFEPNEAVTWQEAAVMLDNVLDTTEVAATAYPAPSPTGRRRPRQTWPPAALLPRARPFPSRSPARMRPRCWSGPWKSWRSVRTETA